MRYLAAHRQLVEVTLGDTHVLCRLIGSQHRLCGEYCVRRHHIGNLLDCILIHRSMNFELWLSDVTSENNLVFAIMRLFAEAQTHYAFNHTAKIKY